MARRVHSLHHNLKPGQNVVFHREHRSKRGRLKHRVKGMAPAGKRNGKLRKRISRPQNPFKTRELSKKELRAARTAAKRALAATISPTPPQPNPYSLRRIWGTIKAMIPEWLRGRAGG